MKSDKDKTTDLGLPRLRRRRTQKMVPITPNMTAVPPMTPPIIARVCDILCGDALVFVVVPLAFMLYIGTLREGGQHRKMVKPIGLTSELMAQTHHLVQG
jgi:hypothetical protein